MKRPTLESRRERVRRVNAKRPGQQRPEIVVVPTYEPDDEVREQLICALVDLLAGTVGR